jgi:hypothetical protein
VVGRLQSSETLRFFSEIDFARFYLVYVGTVLLNGRSDTWVVSHLTSYSGLLLPELLRWAHYAKIHPRCGEYGRMDGSRHQWKEFSRGSGIFADHALPYVCTRRNGLLSRHVHGREIYSKCLAATRVPRPRPTFWNRIDYQIIE